MRKTALIFVLVLLFSTAAFAQVDSVNVTFHVNTALVPDTLSSTSSVQMRGAPPYLTWDHESPVNFTNIGGDYWSATVKWPADSTITYKFFATPDSEITSGSIGWEADVDGGNRTLVIGQADTTLPLIFVNGKSAGLDPWFTPFTVSEDTLSFYVRVNMHGAQDAEVFDPDSHIVGLRGFVSGTTLGNMTWDNTLFMTRESFHANSGQSNYTGTHFWFGEMKVPKDSVAVGDTLQFKRVIHLKEDSTNVYDWEDVPGGGNLKFTVPAADTTLHWSFYEDRTPINIRGEDTLSVSVHVDMANAIANNGFSTSDTLLVNMGYGGTGRDVETSETPVLLRLIRQGFTTTYAGDTMLIGEIGGDLYYQYYNTDTESENRELFYNFFYDGSDVSLQERRVISIDSATVEIRDMEDAQTSLRRMPVFRNKNIISQDSIVVTYTCDLRPAIYTMLAGKVLNDIQGDIWDVTEVDSVIAWGVFMNGPASGGWGTWTGDSTATTNIAERKMFDDGTHGDTTPGDTIYAIQYTYYKDSSHTVGQEFKFGIGGGDNEGGEGGYGNNHVDNIDDTNPTATIAAAFGSINPAFFDAWDYDNATPVVTSIEDDSRPVLPNAYKLAQNYPNPFNPETTIRFGIPKTGHVQIEVFNVLGQKVRMLVNEQKGAGEYTVKWDGKDYRGYSVASGVYIYRMVTENFVEVKKMMLIK